MHEKEEKNRSNERFFFVITFAVEDPSLTERYSAVNTPLLAAPKQRGMRRALGLIPQVCSHFDKRN